MIDRTRFQPRCPSCGQTIQPVSVSQFLPFCSDRCRLVDLGRWLNEEHSVPCQTRQDDEQTSPENTKLPPGWDDP